MRPASLVELAQARRLEEELARPLDEMPRERGERKVKYRKKFPGRPGELNLSVPAGLRVHGCVKANCEERAEAGISYCEAHARSTITYKGTRLYRWQQTRGLLK